MFLSQSKLKKRKERENTFAVVFGERNLHISGPMQFNHVLFKGQLSISSRTT